jgi:cation:H+ antiporter
MDILSALGLVLFGLLLLAGGGEALVRAATTLAELAGVTPAVIGLTVVAIGTSLPELVVSLVAAASGEPDLAVANVVGSNIFNIAATLGLTALIIPLPVHGTAVRLEWPVMFGASFLCLLLARGGALDRLEGGFFLVALVLFIAYTVHIARSDVSAAEARQIAEQVESRDIDAPGEAGPNAKPRLAVTLGVLAIGIVSLIAGGRLLVDGAVALARAAGMTERVIGLTIVAGGTGAPELATSLVAAFRKRTDVAVANIIGSNIFNVLGILGVTALVAPVAVSPALIDGDMWWMVGTSLLLLPLLRSGGRLSRGEGAFLLGVYVVYVTLLLRG